MKITLYAVCNELDHCKCIELEILDMCKFLKKKACVHTFKKRTMYLQYLEV